MSLNSVDMLGQSLGDSQAQQKSTEENLQSDELDATFNLQQSDTLIVRGQVTFTKRFYPDDSFILDHPVYGELDSLVLKLDGGYATQIVGFTFPATFPISFSAISAGSELAYTTEF